MSTWIEVNGARIEKEFFDANVDEAKNYDWVETRTTDLVEHGHCMICGVTIDPKTPPMMRAYKSKGGLVCDYCYGHFLK